jgi:hypothetical protein
VHLADYCAAAQALFGHTVSAPTASRHLADDGFAYRAAHMTKAVTSSTATTTVGGFVVDADAQRAQLWEWVSEQRRSGLFDVPLCKLASVDFVFTGHRTEGEFTFAPRGGGQPH